MLNLPLQPWHDALGAAMGWRWTHPPGRPGLRVEHLRAPAPWGLFLGGRLRSPAGVHAWYVINDWWDHVELLQGPAPLGILPPITAREAEARAPDAWLRPLLAALAASPASPLHGGVWWAGPASLWPFTRLRVDVAEAAARPPCAHLADHQGRLLPLRPLSDGRRVGFWRKHARAGTLPPPLLLALSHLELYAILDGHDRLLAAHLEGTPTDPVVIAPLVAQRWEASAHHDQRAALAATVDRLGPDVPAGLNRAVIRAWADPRHDLPRTRAWLYPGGLDAWQADVRLATRHLDRSALTLVDPA